jgi:WD40 repeat protein
VGQLRLLGAAREAGHEGEVFCCAYTPDGGGVLSGGWDGHLRLWEAATGRPLAALPTGPKPLSCCGLTPDGRSWVSGSMEGQLTFWDAVTHQPQLDFMAHTRPISAVVYAPDGQALASASWDRLIQLRKAGKEREGRALSGHQDIVAGCCFTPDGGWLLSWSYDGTVRLWDAELAQPIRTLGGHEDRVTAGAVSPDGLWAASGGRDGVLKLWDLTQQTEAAVVPQEAEVRACFFLPDGESLLTADADGWVSLLAVPSMDVRDRLETGVALLCADLAPAGSQLALGGEDGFVHRVALEGVASAPLPILAKPQLQETYSGLGRLLGKKKVTRTWRYRCPACRKEAEAHALPSKPFPCPHCHRQLRVNAAAPQLQVQ